MFKKFLPWIKNVLAVYGLLLLIALPGQRIYQTVSMTDAVAFVIPICERYVFGPTDEVSFYSSKEWRYVGVNILASNPVINPRVRFSDVFLVTEWGMYSDGLSDAEIQDFLSELPIGELPNEFVTPPLPDLAAETMTTLMMIGRPLLDGYCGSTSHVEMTATQGDIYHGVQNSRTVREFPNLFLSPGWLVVAFYVVPLVIIAALFLVRRYAAQKSPNF